MKLIHKVLPASIINKLRLLKYSRVARKKGIPIKQYGNLYELDNRYYVNSKQLGMVIKHFEYLTKILKHYIVDFRNSELLECRLWGYHLKTDIQSIKTIGTEIKPYLRYYRLKNKDVILDMGAYHGIFSFYVLSKNPNTTIYAFEPDPISFKVLCENITRNRIKNIIPINKANWHVNQKLKLKQNKRGSQISDKGIDINSINIPTFTKKYDINKIDFVKMDIEGAEIEVVKDMLQKGYYANTNYAIASYHIINNKKTKYALESLFLEKGIKTKSENEHLTTYTIKEMKK